MLPVALSLRFLMLVASLGAMLGACLMFFEGGARLVGAVAAVSSGGLNGDHSVVSAVMRATDEFLFGIVLVVIAYAVAFGFVFELRAAQRARMPRWMRLGGVAELKRVFFEVILVYLAVDFATDIADSETHLTWQTLVMPLSIAALAVAARLLHSTADHDGSGEGGSETARMEADESFPS